MKGCERTFAEIDLGALKNNVTETIKIIGDGVRLIAVVKADGYGHGAVPAAKAARECGVDTFGVATIDEAIELRENGIDENIMILSGCFKPRLKDIIDYGIEQTVFTVDMARELQKTAKELGKTAKTHIKIDTGLSRIGFQPSEKTTDEILEILGMENVRVMGLMTHFASSGHKDKTYTEMQYERFMAVVEALKEKGAVIPPLHVSNSAATVDLKKMHFGAVRVGIMLYGIYPSQDVHKELLNLMPVMSWKASVSLVKTIGSGECVSYNSRFMAEKDTVVATIPIGYADGFSRLLGNGKGSVLIRGMRCPTLGDVCMDQFMVDATGVPGVQAGDEAVLLGKQGGDEITADEMAENRSTISYEIVCDVLKRVPRVYK